MIEPISIVGLTFSIVGLLSMVRNGVITLHRDKREFAEFDSILEDLYNELETWEIRIKSWKALWMVQEGESETLFATFWGGNNSITQRLSRIKTTAETIRNLLAQLDSKSNANLLEKFKFDLIRPSQLRDLLATLKLQVELLDNYSMDLFRAEHSVYDKPDRMAIETAKNEEIQRFLVSLVKATSTTSTSLYEFCNDVDQENHDTQIIGLELDLMESEKFASWFANVENFANIGELTFYLLVRYKNSGPAWRVRIKPISVGSCSDVQGSESLERELNKLYSQDGQQGFLAGSNNLYFQLQGTLVGQATYSHPLVVGLMKVQQTYLIGAPAPLSEPTRLDIIYGLVKCGLLLLETPWFADLCSGGIQQVTLPDKTLYTFRVQPIEHQIPEPLSPENCVSSKCCRSSFTSENGKLFVLGIILIEIALGTPVLKVHHDQSLVSSIEICSKSGTQKIKKSVMMIMVEDATGSCNYRQVVDYCLRCSLQGTSESNLNNFFQKALLPIEQFRDNLLESRRRAKARRERGRERGRERARVRQSLR